MTRKVQTQISNLDLTLTVISLGRNIEVHSMHPTWMAESSQWNIIMAALGIVAIVGLSYFINYGKYLQRLM